MAQGHIAGQKGLAQQMAGRGGGFPGSCVHSLVVGSGVALPRKQHTGLRRAPWGPWTGTL